MSQDLNLCLEFYHSELTGTRSKMVDTAPDSLKTFWNENQFYPLSPKSLAGRVHNVLKKTFEILFEAIGTENTEALLLSFCQASPLKSPMPDDLTKEFYEYAKSLLDKEHRPTLEFEFKKYLCATTPGLQKSQAVLDTQSLEELHLELSENLMFHDSSDGQKMIFRSLIDQQVKVCGVDDDYLDLIEIAQKTSFLSLDKLGEAWLDAKGTSDRTEHDFGALIQNSLNIGLGTLKQRENNE